MKKLVFISVMVVMGVALSLAHALALQVFEGQVEHILNRFIRYDLVVKGFDGRKITFRTGFTTRYTPNRMPLVGERVRIEYFMKRTAYIAKVVTVVAPDAPYAAPRPAPSPPPAPAPTPPPRPEAIVQPDIKLSGQLTVFRPQVNIRSGPGTQYGVIGGAVEGQKLVLKGQTQSWYYVFIPEGQHEGWIYSGLVNVDKIAVPPSTPEEPSSAPQRGSGAM